MANRKPPLNPFPKGNTLSKNRRLNRWKEMQDELDKRNFNVLDEAIAIYRNSETKTGDKISVLKLIADKTLPSLKAIEVDMTADVEVSKPLDLSKLTDAELESLSKVAAMNIVESDDDDETDS